MANSWDALMSGLSYACYASVHARRLRIHEGININAVEECFDPIPAPWLVPAMPSKQHGDETNPAVDEPLHKTTINFPASLYEDLRLLAAFEPGGSLNAILERAAREFVERERETLDQLKRIAEKRSGVRTKR